jgi:hypothetical protein
MIFGLEGNVNFLSRDIFPRGGRTAVRPYGHCE